MPGFATRSIYRDNNTPRACFLLPESYTSMVGWMGQSKGWPDGRPGIANPVQFTTYGIRNSGGDTFKSTIGGHHDHSACSCFSRRNFQRNYPALQCT
ncbi:ash family protein [Serratia symbiotica]|uniref:ash family protein n=1 Tax=Serratia symbiotica TaxID=138074 RepID=UPI00396A838A